MEHFEQVCLAVDETLDRGIVLETDAREVVARVLRRESAAEGPTADSPTSTLGGMFAFAKEKFAKTILKQ